METFEWPPLESDPQIFTEYFHNIGLNSQYHFEELYALDYVPEGNILGVIISYETGVNGKVKRDEEKFLTYDSVPYYMKQTKKLDNACGVIASIHSVFNNREDNTIKQNSILENFYNESKDKSDAERASTLETSNDFKKSHTNFAGQGQSNLCGTQDDVKHHFVAFVYINGDIVELDGCIKGPYIVKKGVSKENFAQETFDEIKRRLESKNISDSIAMMYLTKDD